VGDLDEVEDFVTRLDILHLLTLREADGLGSFLGGRVRIFPHQLHVAERACASDPVRWLLADEVGLGKTIEAALILNRLVHAGKVERCLVVAPGALTVQWLGELWRKYHQVFTLFDERRLADVERITREVERVAGGSSRREGTGGMVTKVRAAERAAACGAGTLIIDGRRTGALSRALRGEDVGTMFFATPQGLNSRQQWIAHAVRVSGQLWLDAGAVRAVVEGRKSLLPSGVIKVSGEFAAGDAVACLDSVGRVVARGLVNYAAPEVAKICGLKTSEIAKQLGYKYYDEVIHRDNLVVDEEFRIGSS